MCIVHNMHMHMYMHMHIQMPMYVSMYMHLHVHVQLHMHMISFIKMSILDAEAHADESYTRFVLFTWMYCFFFESARNILLCFQCDAF